MLARAYVYLERPFADVAGTLIGPSQAWLAGLDGASGEDLLARVGIELQGLRVYRHVRVSTGDASSLSDGGTSIPLAWHPSGGEALLPDLHGTLDVEAVGARTQLTLNANYTPPLGFLGSAVNRLLLYRLADATILDFVQRVANNVERILAGPPRPDR